jgi:hypothetical protein
MLVTPAHLIGGLRTGRFVSVCADKAGSGWRLRGRKDDEKEGIDRHASRPIFTVQPTRIVRQTIFPFPKQQQHAHCRLLHAHPMWSQPIYD